MNTRFVLSSCAAALLSVTAAAGQTTTQTPTQSPVQGSTQGITGQTPTPTARTGTQVTVTGCVVRESEHTRARGGVLGTGVGAANEYVLANAVMGQSGAKPNAQIAGSVSGSTSTGTGSATAGTTGTSGSTTIAAPQTARGGLTYSLTGNRESDLTQHVGKRVEIVGTIDTAIRPSITAAPPQGEAAANLQELTIVSFRPAEGTCQ
jgi:hypothetical protein